MENLTNITLQDLQSKHISNVTKLNIAPLSVRSETGWHLKKQK